MFESSYKDPSWRKVSAAMASKQNEIGAVYCVVTALADPP